MDDLDLRLLKDELATQSHAHRNNQFTEDFRSYCFEEKIKSKNNRDDSDCILYAKNAWETCVDSIEHQAIIIVDRDLNVLRANRTIESWGWGDVNKVSGTHILNLIKPALKDIPSKDFLSEWSQLNLQENIEWESNSSISGKKYRFLFYPIRDLDSLYHDEDCYAVLLITDITKNKSSSNKTPTDCLLASEHQENTVPSEVEKRLKLLSEKMITIQEIERNRVSCELHDGVGQVLSALKFQIESVIKESLKTSQQRKNDEILSDVLNNIKVAQNDLKRISVDLRPSIIEELGLLMALRWFIAEYQKVYTDINIDLQLDVYESTILDSIKNIIYRIVQESMNNISKYANADTVKIQLTSSEDGLLLRISDNGCGFDVNKTKNKPCSGLGVNIMEERAVSSGAKFTLSSNVSIGTVIQVFWCSD